MHRIHFFTLLLLCAGYSGAQQRASIIVQDKGEAFPMSSYMPARQIVVDPDFYNAEYLEIAAGTMSDTFRRKSLEVNQLGYRVWIGKSTTDSMYSAVLLEKDTKLNGTLHLGGKTYRITPSKDSGGHVLAESDFSQMIGCAISERNEVPHE